MVSWSEATGALGYQVFLDGVAYGEIQLATAFNLSMLEAETYIITVQAIGDQINCLQER